jgi:hypothetical protein
VREEHDPRIGIGDFEISLEPRIGEDDFHRLGG